MHRYIMILSLLLSGVSFARMSEMRKDSIDDNLSIMVSYENLVFRLFTDDIDEDKHSIVKMEIYLRLGLFKTVDFSFDNDYAVDVRFDAEAAETWHCSRSTGYEALFIDDVDRFLKKCRKSKIVKLRYDGKFDRTVYEIKLDSFDDELHDAFNRLRKAIDKHKKKHG